ncbi:MAG: alpha/beta hydrolase, partial [Anaerolineaceae bacterium]|nr:alpha/beta hydrolase [Anaerolineaceae bacterium]
SWIERKFLDVAYADRSTAQLLDIYLPSGGTGPFPVIVSIHGGAFRFGDKRDGQVIPMLEGLKRGYAVVSINYRMSGEALFPALVHDVKAAIRWIRARAEDYGFDPTRVAVWGGSAGGWLTLMAGLTEHVAELDDLSLGNAEQSCAVQAVVDWFGPTDFLQMDPQLRELGLEQLVQPDHDGPESPESLLLGQTITEAPELVRKANPETYIHAGAPPFLIQHGDKDDTVPCLQSVRIAEKLLGVLGKDRVTLELLEGAVHADAVFGTSENLEKVFAFLGRYLK